MTIHPFPILPTIAIALAFSGLQANAQSKFLFSTNNSVLSSCTLPLETPYIVITGMRDGDTYFSRTGPGYSFDFTNEVYPYESYIRPEKPFLITADKEAANLCDKIENGDTSEATINEFHAKISAGAYWWEVGAPSGNYWDHYSPRTDGIPEFPPEKNVNGYLSASVTSLATEDTFTAAQKRIYGVGKTNVIGRGFSATVFKLEGVDTDHAFFETTPTPRDYWRSCVFDTGRLFYDENGDGISPPENGVAAGCYDFIKNDFSSDPYSGEKVSANCIRGILYWGDYGEPVEYDGNEYWQTTGSAWDLARVYRESDHLYGERGQFQDFDLLCPLNSQRLRELGCKSGNPEACSE